ncbi:hypothetical protein SHL15_1187 [Streptomyces hygroscopicus subsp. limoneus]|nr:hypothetical protein SHL15_1187 [Streptomyces hygroscopicus subsp. limoneus]
MVGSFAELPAGVSGVTWERVVSAEDDGRLLVAVLKEVVYLMDAAGEVPVDVAVTPEPGGVRVRFTVADSSAATQTGAVPQGRRVARTRTGPGAARVDVPGDAGCMTPRSGVRRRNASSRRRHRDGHRTGDGRTLAVLASSGPASCVCPASYAPHGSCRRTSLATRPRSRWRTWPRCRASSARRTPCLTSIGATASRSAAWPGALSEAAAAASATSDWAASRTRRAVSADRRSARSRPTAHTMCRG